MLSRTQDLHSERCNLVVLIRSFSLRFCPLSLISKALFSFPAPHQLETRCVETTELSGVLEACWQSRSSPLQRLATTTWWGGGKETLWWLQSVEEGPTRGIDLGSSGLRKTRTRMFYLKGEEVGWEKVRKLTQNLEINKWNALKFVHNRENMVLESTKLSSHHLIWCLRQPLNKALPLFLKEMESLNHIPKQTLLWTLVLKPEHTSSDYKSIILFPVYFCIWPLICFLCLSSEYLISKIANALSNLIQGSL